MPRRSTGCERCRKRRVRCDERKPHCLRCEDHRTICPGYRPSAEKDLRFVDQTRSVLDRAGSKFVQSRQPCDPSGEPGSKKYQFLNSFGQTVKIQNPDGISKRHVHRIQLLTTFLDLYLPKKTRKSTSHFEYVAQLPNLDISSPLLQVSIDTLCLAELGSLYEDERCLHESLVKYTRALPMLSRELSKPASKQLPKDHILTAIVVLALCELFDTIARSDEGCHGWINHVGGAQQYVQAKGTQAIASPYGWMLFHNVRHSSLCKGFVERKAVSFAEPEWLRMTEDLGNQDPYVALYDLAIRIPGLLERADALSVSGHNLTHSATLCQDIRHLRVGLDRWLSLWYSDQRRDLYRVVDVRDMKEFSQLCLDRTFQTVFDFNSFEECSQLQLYWTCCIFLDCTLLSIRGQHLFSDSKQLDDMHRLVDRTDEVIKRDMFVAAAAFCRSVPFCCEREIASVGRMGTFLLRLVEVFFEQFDYCNESEWCKAVRRMSAKHAQNASDRREALDGEVLIGPWDVKHRCKSPICNFKVECSAPAPMLLSGEHPGKGALPGHPSTEKGFVHGAAKISE